MDLLTIFQREPAGKLQMAAHFRDPRIWPMYESATILSERALADARAFLGPNLWHQPNWWIGSSAVLCKELQLGRSADMCRTP
jgi:hypothetical protein